MTYGFTTGSCAAAASKAAAYMLLGSTRIHDIKIDTPAGIEYNAQVEDVNIDGDTASCAVRKYSGDDPDITSGALIYAEVTLVHDGEGSVNIDGGKGVGRVTRPGLDRPVGSAAINSVPLQMIEREVREVMELFDCADSCRVIISVPAGEELALKTFNPRLGIEGGISIIGTSGIVEPMSTAALIDTIRVELRQIYAEGVSCAVISPGNYGLDFMQTRFGYDLDKAVKCSNYIGETIDMACELGFKELMIVGHIGKLIKLSGGIMNTHSKEADCRMELMAAAAIRCGAESETLKHILDSVTTEEAYKHMEDAGIADECMSYIMERISFYLNKRAQGKVKIDCIVFSNASGLLGATDGAEDVMRHIAGEQEA